QVLATDGVQTAAAVSASVAVPVRPRTVAIKAPSSSEVHLGETLRLVAEAFSPSAGSASPQELEWSSDRSGFLDRGHEVRLSALCAGRHTITVRAPHGPRGQVSAEIDVVVTRQAPRKEGSRDHGS